MSFFQKILNLIHLFVMKCNKAIYFKVLKKYVNLSSLHFKPTIKSIYKQCGVTLVEAVVVAAILATLAIGTTYFLAQNRATLSSSSQLMECQVIAKQALEKVVSLGSRLYGYRINDSKSEFRYAPLFIKKKR